MMRLIPIQARVSYTRITGEQENSRDFSRYLFEYKNELVICKVCFGNTDRSAPCSQILTATNPESRIQKFEHVAIKDDGT